MLAAKVHVLLALTSLAGLALASPAQGRDRAPHHPLMRAEGARPPRRERPDDLKEQPEELSVSARYSRTPSRRLVSTHESTPERPSGPSTKTVASFIPKALVEGRKGAAPVVKDRGLGEEVNAVPQLRYEKWINHSFTHDNMTVPPAPPPAAAPTAPAPSEHRVNVWLLKSEIGRMYATLRKIQNESFADVPSRLQEALKEQSEVMHNQTENVERLFELKERHKRFRKWRRHNLEANMSHLLDEYVELKQRVVLEEMRPV